MFHKFRSSPRFQLIALAASLGVIASYFSLCASLTDETKPLDATFQVEHGSEFGISIEAPGYEAGSIINPGSSAAFDPLLKNEGYHDAYVFIKVTLPDQTFHLTGLDTGWYKLSSDGNTSIYSYGTSKELTALPAMDEGDDDISNAPATSPLCEGLALASDTDLGDGEYTLHAIGYAIQADENASNDPAKVWETLGKEREEESQNQ